MTRRAGGAPMTSAGGAPMTSAGGAQMSIVPEARK
jgi:hypothetical protein